MQLAGNLGETTGALVEHARFPWTMIEANYCCVSKPVFDSTGQSREKDFYFYFFPVSDIYIIHFLKPIFFRNVFFHMLVSQSGADVQSDQHQQVFSFNNYI